MCKQKKLNPKLLRYKTTKSKWNPLWLYELCKNLSVRINKWPKVCWPPNWSQQYSFCFVKFQMQNCQTSTWNWWTKPVPSSIQLAVKALTYSSSWNLTPPISRVLIGHLIFCSLTSPTCCNSPRKCTPIKYKVRQKAGFPIVT